MTLPTQRCGFPFLKEMYIDNQRAEIQRSRSLWGVVVTFKVIGIAYHIAALVLGILVIMGKWDSDMATKIVGGMLIGNATCIALLTGAHFIVTKKMGLCGSAIVFYITVFVIGILTLLHTIPPHISAWLLLIRPGCAICLTLSCVSLEPVAPCLGKDAYPPSQRQNVQERVPGK